MPSTIEERIEKIIFIKVTRVMNNKSAKITNINPNLLTYTEVVSHSDRA